MSKVNEVVKNFIEEVIEVSETTGTLPWSQGWNNGGSWSRRSVNAKGEVTKKYSTFNSFLLSIGYDENGKIKVDNLCGEWASFKEIQAEGGKVIKGSKGRHIVFFTFIEEKDKDGNTVLDDNGKVKKYPVLRYYTVFHIETMTDLTPKHVGEIKHAPIEDLDEIITNYVSNSGGLKLDIRQSDRAYYSPSMDMVVIPQLSQYANTAEYYSTAFHELVHSTGHASRLDRKFNASVAFGSEDYSREELVAEIGSATIMNLTKYENKQSRNNSIAYVQGWLKALKDDPMMLMWASNRADKAVDMILGTN